MRLTFQNNARNRHVYTDDSNAERY